MKSKSLLTSKFTLLILLVSLVFLGQNKYKQYKQSEEVEKEKQKILAQRDAIQKKNQEIYNSIEYFNSDGFKQRIAREQLNFKQQGEQVYSFVRSSDNNQITQNSGSNNKEPNPIKWLKYFAGENF